jgi:hypothetical protein
MKSAIHTCEHAAEALFIRQVLLTFVDRCTHELHTRFHAQFRTVRCHAVAPLEHEAQWLASNQSSQSARWEARPSVVPVKATADS